MGVKVIASNSHETVPQNASKEELIHRLRLMQILSSILREIAVMPNSARMFSRSLSATLEMAGTYAEPPDHYYVHVGTV